MNNIKYFKAWAIFALVAMVGGFLVGAVIGFILGALLGIAGVSLKDIKTITGIVGFCLGLIVSYYTFRWSVKKYIIDPLLAAAPRDDSGTPPFNS
ncbi:MAG: hypothetical protein SFY80_06220 [Verrucomicrobiota bacterium]|nr:hypothetical protein [Verrucomicrobiota bacterium]